MTEKRASQNGGLEGRMKKIIIITVALFIMSAFYAHAAEVKNVKPHQEGKRILFEYDLVSDSGEDEAEVTITLTIEGKTYTSDNLHFEGDYGEKVKTGRNRKIYWNVLQDFPKGFSQTFQWEIVAGGKEYKDPITGMEFVFVRGGCYQMGDGPEDEKPVHEVCVDDFYIGKYEVTQGQWKAIMWNNPSHFKNCGDNCPVEQVSWNDAQKFIQKLNQRSSKQYRLPTEAEWEYAARSGGKKEKYAGGDNVDSVAWYSSNSGDKTHTVGTKSPNGLGIYDMSGNVLEWVQDWYNEDAYSKHSRNNPTYDISGATRVVRGGGWYNVPWNVRCANRHYYAPGLGGYSIGFRLLRTP